jgi:UDP-glucuronate decarboxylase
MTSHMTSDDVEIIAKNLGDRVHKFSGKTLLLSGSTGFLGRHFLLAIHHFNQHYLERPCQVIAIDNAVVRPTTWGQLESEYIEHKLADICAPIQIDQPLDYIVHMAGIASPAYYLKFPLETIRAAVHGTENLLELARNHRLEKFLIFSSSEIYGDPPEHAIPTPEHYKGQVSTTGPRACYDESKRMAETLAVTYHQLYGIPVQILRPFNVYGPGMRADDRRVVPQFLTCALQGKPLPIHGHGLQTRSYCYITDAITGFMLALLTDRSGEAYNIGNPHEMSLNDLAEEVVRLVPGANIQRIPYPDSYPADEPMRRCPDIRKALEHLEYQPQIHLTEGLERTLAWFRRDLDLPVELKQLTLT